jgi:TPP-dependent 2-oxoacid decarboxylase
MAAITIGEYLLKRLKEVGVDTVFGVPGDYNMVIIIVLRLLVVLGYIIAHSLAFVGYD